MLAVALGAQGAPLLLAATAAASEIATADSETDTISQGPRVRMPEDSTHICADGWPCPSGMWFWPEARRAFVLSQGYDEVSKTWPDELYGRELIAIDSVDGKEVGRIPLDPPAVRSGDWHGEGQEHTVLVDRAAGRVFVAHSLLPAVGKSGGGGTSPEMAANLEGAVNGQMCGTTAVQVLGQLCFGGVTVIDAKTLTVERQLSLRQLMVEEPGLYSPRLLAMSDTPAVDGGDGKLLVLVQSDGPHRLVSQGTLSVAQQTNLTFAVQFDVATGNQDWAVRMPNCRGNRTDDSEVQRMNTTGLHPHPGAILHVPGDGAVYVGCHAGTARQGVVVRIPLGPDGRPAGTLPSAAPDVDGLASAPSAQRSPRDLVPALAAGQQTFLGPEYVLEYRTDPVTGRLLLRENKARTELWWVFDPARRAFIGAIGIGGYSVDFVASGFDQRSGRLYVLAQPAGEASGGLYVADVRGEPLPQALHFPQFAGTVRREDTLFVDHGVDGRPTRVFLNDGRTFVDRLPVRAPAAAPSDPWAGLSQDVDEAEGATARTFDGTARGYGARLILQGGAATLARAPGVDPWSNIDGGYDQWGRSALGLSGSPLADGPVPWGPCPTTNREVVLGFVGPDGNATVDASGSRGGAQPVWTDEQTAQDVPRASSRCGSGADQLTTSTALLRLPPIAGADVPWPFAASESQCVSSSDGGETREDWEDPYFGAFASHAACDGRSADGWASSRGLEHGGVSVSRALSNFSIYRDAERGLVARVESIARGVAIDGVVRIDTVRGSAESWANGRQSPDAEVAEGTDDPAVDNPFNCDRSRTAGTCFQRHLFGVWIGDGKGGTAYQCGQCGDEEALISAINSALGVFGQARFRQPDARLARGADNGYIAAIVKPDSERVADMIMNTDLLQSTLPALEIVRYAPTVQPPNGAASQDYDPERGRQILQLAGVEVSSTYGIQCLLVHDEEAGTCAPPTVQPGSIQVSLSDPDGEPLAGGAFELRQDVDADGVLGLADTLLPDGACVTAEDGIGTCTFDDLAPGAYLVVQVAPPPGYAKSDEPWASEVAPGERRTVAFTNVSNVSVIELTATDDAGAPVAGAAFAAYPDEDADGKVAPDARPAAQCTTGADGRCTMRVPAGSYVLVQTAAPGGLEGIEPVAFTFASGGQVAAVSVVNFPPGSPEEPAAPAAPVYSPPVHSSPPVEAVGDYTPPATGQEPGSVAPPIAARVGSTITQVIRAPGDALRLIARDPKQAVAWTAALALLCLALLAVRRRQLLTVLAATPAPAWAGPAPRPGPPRSPGPPPAPRGPAAPRDPHGPGGHGHGGAPGPRSGSGAPAGQAPVAGEPPGPAPRGRAAAQAPAAQPGGGVALRERGHVAGAALSPTEGVHALVVLVSADAALSQIATARIEAAERCRLAAHVDTVAELRILLSAAPAEAVLVIDLALDTGMEEDICDLVAGLWTPERVVGIIPPTRSAEALLTRGCAVGLGGLLAAYDDLSNGQLGYAVRCVAVGKLYYGPVVQRALVTRLSDQFRSPKEAPSAVLSARELEVALLAVDGHGRAAIAEKLFLSPETVKRHLRAIRRKLGVTNPRAVEQLRRRLEEAGLAGEIGPTED